MRRFFSSILLSLAWLPLGIILITAARGIPAFIEPQAWLGLVVLAPCGLPLVFACRALQRTGHPVWAWASFIVLAPATVGSVMFAGLLGPLAIVVYALVLSLPAWAVHALFRHRAKNQEA